MTLKCAIHDQDLPPDSRPCCQFCRPDGQCAASYDPQDDYDGRARIRALIQAAVRKARSSNAKKAFRERLHSALRDIQKRRSGGGGSGGGSVGAPRGRTIHGRARDKSSRGTSKSAWGLDNPESKRNETAIPRAKERSPEEVPLPRDFQPEADPYAHLDEWEDFVSDMAARQSLGDQVDRDEIDLLFDGIAGEREIPEEELSQFPYATQEHFEAQNLYESEPGFEFMEQVEDYAQALEQEVSGLDQEYEQPTSHEVMAEPMGEGPGVEPGGMMDTGRPVVEPPVVGSGFSGGLEVVPPDPMAVDPMMREEGFRAEGRSYRNPFAGPSSETLNPTDPGPDDLGPGM